MVHVLRLPPLDWSDVAYRVTLRLLFVVASAVCAIAAHAQAAPTMAQPEPPELRFRDFYQMPVGPAGLEVSPTLRDSDGTAVRLVGYMVQQDKTVPGRFLLAPRPVQMSEHADGEADDLPPATVVVTLAAEQQGWVVPHVRGLVAVSGLLSVGRVEEPDGRVSWVRLQLAPWAARSMNPVEMSVFLHSRLHSH